MVIGYGQKDKVYQQRVWFLWGWGNRVWSDCSKDTAKGCGSWDRVIGMKGTGKGCGSSGDGVTRCGQRDKGQGQIQLKVKCQGHFKVKYLKLFIITKFCIDTIL